MNVKIELLGIEIKIELLGIERLNDDPFYTALELLGIEKLNEIKEASRGSLKSSG